MKKILLATLVSAVGLAALSSSLSNAQVGCRIIKHTQGETCVPLRAKRVIVLHDAILLEPVLALGVQPIASTTYWFERGIYYRNVPENITKQIEPIGGITQPNLEKILALRPDLIIGRPGQHDAIYAQLAKIAPTVYPPEAGVNLEDSLRFLGRVLNRSTTAEIEIAKYRDTIEQYRLKLRRLEPNLLVSRLRVAGNTLTTYGDADTVTQIFKGLGLKRPAAQEALKDEVVTLSPETVVQHDANVIFLRLVGDSKIENAVPPALWNQLAAVKAGKVVVVDWAAFSLPSAKRVLADVERILLKR